MQTPKRVQPTQIARLIYRRGHNSDARTMSRRPSSYRIILPLTFFYYFSVLGPNAAGRLLVDHEREPKGVRVPTASVLPPPETIAPQACFSTNGLPISLLIPDNITAADCEVAVGTTPGGDEVREFRPVGLRSQIFVRDLGLIPGRTYYVKARFVGVDGSVGQESATVAIHVDPSAQHDQMYLPWWVESTDLYTGLAVVNSMATTRAFLIRGYVEGKLEPIETSWVLHPGEQFARLISQPDLLGEEAADAEGWLELSYSGERPSAMYLIGDSEASRTLTGSPLLNSGVDQVIPELDRGRAEITLLNPGASGTELRLEIIGSLGPKPSKTLVIDSQQSLQANISVRILSGRSDASIAFGELCNLLNWLGFQEHVRGGHHLFRRDGVPEMINLQREGNKAKSYQVRQVRTVIVNNQLGVID